MKHVIWQKIIIPQLELSCVSQIHIKQSKWKQLYLVRKIKLVLGLHSDMKLEQTGGYITKRHGMYRITRAYLLISWCLAVHVSNKLIQGTSEAMPRLPVNTLRSLSTYLRDTFVCLHTVHLIHMTRRFIIIYERQILHVFCHIYLHNDI